jgi:hypothetical protein
MSSRRTFEERLAERQAKLGPPKDGGAFEHGPARFLFFSLISLIVVAHVGVLIVMMLAGVH